MYCADVVVADGPDVVEDLRQGNAVLRVVPAPGGVVPAPGLDDDAIVVVGQVAVERARVLRHEGVAPRCGWQHRDACRSASGPRRDSWRSSPRPPSRNASCGISSSMSPFGVLAIQGCLDKLAGAQKPVREQKRRLATRVSPSPYSMATLASFTSSLAIGLVLDLRPSARAYCRWARRRSPPCASGSRRNGSPSPSRCSRDEITFFLGVAAGARTPNQVPSRSP